MSNRPNNKKPSSSQRIAAAQGASSSAGRNRVIWIAGAVALVLVFALVVTLVAKGGDDDSKDVASGGASSGTTIPASGIDYGTVEVTGTALPTLAQTGDDTAIGETSPVVTGQQYDGANISIGGPSADGKPTVVIGVAHWCPHCQKEVPIIQEWIDDNGMPTDVNLVALSTSQAKGQSNWPAPAWLNEEGWSVPTLVDDADGTAANAIGLSSFPYMLVLDAQGKVVYRTSGEKTVAEWEAIVDKARDSGTASASS